MVCLWFTYQSELQQKWEEQKHSSHRGFNQREHRGSLLLPYGVEYPADGKLLRLIPARHERCVRDRRWFFWVCWFSVAPVWISPAKQAATGLHSCLGARGLFAWSDKHANISHDYDHICPAVKLIRHLRCACSAVIKKTQTIKEALKRIQLQIRGHTHHLFGEADGTWELPQLFLIQSQCISHVHTVALTTGGRKEIISLKYKTQLNGI